VGARGYDPMDLGRRIAVCFSSGDLRKLAEELGVEGSIAWGRGTAETARDLVRCFERKNNLEGLVAKLREVRPLVEWPDPPSAAPSEGTAPADAQASGGAAAGALGGPGDLGMGPLGEPSEGVADATAPSAAGGPAISPPASPAAVPPEPAISTRAPAPTESSGTGALPSAAWPGTVPNAPPPQAGSRGVDPRLLIIVPALTLLAVIIAFIAGRAGSGPEPSAPAAPSSAPQAAGTAEPEAGGSDDDGPAARVSDAILRSLANVARACEIPLRGPATEEVLLQAFDQCGPPPPELPRFDPTSSRADPNDPGL
jgi:hypothetical protein